MLLCALSKMIGQISCVRPAHVSLLEWCSIAVVRIAFTLHISLFIHLLSQFSPADYIRFDAVERYNMDQMDVQMYKSKLDIALYPNLYTIIMYGDLNRIVRYVESLRAHISV